MNTPSVSNREIYEATQEGELVHAPLGPGDLPRFAATAKYLRSDIKSLLDVGCHTADWLNYIVKKHGVEQHLGIDVARNRLEEGKRRYPHLNLRVCFAEELDVPPGSFDAVTSMEVLEHIPDWLSVLHSMLRIAAKQVLVTVPYRQQIVYTVCIHCAKMTPLYGHLRSYSEETFPHVKGWKLSFAKLRDQRPSSGSLARRLYRRVVPHYPWMLANYERENP